MATETVGPTGKPVSVPRPMKKRRGGGGTVGGDSFPQEKKINLPLIP